MAFQDVLRTAYKSRPSGRLGVEAVNFFRNTWLRSLRASLFFRSRWKRALSPLSADMVTQDYHPPARLANNYSVGVTRIGVCRRLPTVPHCSDFE